MSITSPELRKLGHQSNDENRNDFDEQKSLLPLLAEKLAKKCDIMIGEFPLREHYDDIEFQARMNCVIRETQSIFREPNEN